ncbi:MAG TPA: SRPBCC domain-containing protein [Burkholderiales bacterium]|jgi:uncharacterized protein YndB with AHSA1/START domain|nr:SRPBCC domain-containing protein [Burkholderiales bacterium]
MSAVANIPTVIVRRRIAASAQELFDAWLDPAALAQWFRPEASGSMLSTVTVDARVGGGFDIVMHIPSRSCEGGTAGPPHHFGIYQVIEAPRRLVFTWNSYHDGQTDSLVTVEFHPEGKITEVVITHERLPEDRRDGHAAGWTELLGSLEKVFTA